MGNEKNRCVRKFLFNISIFLLSLLFLRRVSSAQFTNFDFSLKNYLILENRELEISFSYKLTGYKNDDFTVRPKIGRGVVEIFDSGKNSWVNSVSPSSVMPKLEEKMLIRIKNLEIEKTLLWFEIKNVKEGKVYTTPSKNIWSEKIFDGYIEELGESTVEFVKSKQESVEETILGVSDVSETTSSLGFLDQIPKNIYLYISLGSFSLSAVVGFLSVKAGKSREMIQSIGEDF